MSLAGSFYNIFGKKHDFVPIFAQQASFLCQTSTTLVAMLETSDESERKRYEREIKICEVQGDALLTEFQETLRGRILGVISKSDLQSIAMSMDDCLDVFKDAAKAILIYHPKKIDGQLLDLAKLIMSEATALRDLLPLLKDLRRNVTQISLHCDRVTELEHAADDAYEEYIGYIFENEPDLREMTKYKNLAEIFETATDSEKHVSDIVRKTLLKHTGR